jgi:translation elongation factor EF-1alpha
MHLLNLGVLAHVDAGKTTLTERLLFDAGVLAAPGSVDSGTTVTDTMTLERRRGITIRTGVASFRVNETVVNVIDTPGHPDFIAEVDRALAVLDGAVLVVLPSRVSSRRPSCCGARFVECTCPPCSSSTKWIAPAPTRRGSSTRSGRGSSHGRCR